MRVTLFLLLRLLIKCQCGAATGVDCGFDVTSIGLHASETETTILQRTTYTKSMKYTEEMQGKKESMSWANTEQA
jgi:hypothetical protein